MLRLPKPRAFFWNVLKHHACIYIDLDRVATWRLADWHPCAADVGTAISSRDDAVFKVLVLKNSLYSDSNCIQLRPASPPYVGNPSVKIKRFVSFSARRPSLVHKNPPMLANASLLAEKISHQPMTIKRNIGGKNISVQSQREEACPR